MEIILTTNYLSIKMGLLGHILVNGGIQCFIIHEPGL